MNLRVDPRLKLYQQDKRDRVPVHRLLWVHLWRYVGWAWFASIQCNWANIIYCLFSEKYKNIGVADGQSYGADSLCTFTIYGNKYKGRNKTGELFSPTYPGNIHPNQILDHEYWVRFPMSKRFQSLVSRKFWLQSIKAFWHFSFSNLLSVYWKTYFKGTYPKNIKCGYKFLGEPGQRIRLEFRDFDLFYGGAQYVPLY